MSISNPAHPLNPINPANPVSPIHHDLYGKSSHHYHAEVHQHIPVPTAKQCVGGGFGMIVIVLVIVGLFKVW